MKTALSFFVGLFSDNTIESKLPAGSVGGREDFILAHVDIDFGKYLGYILGVKLPAGALGVWVK